MIQDILNDQTTMFCLWFIGGAICSILTIFIRQDEILVGHILLAAIYGTIFGFIAYIILLIDIITYFVIPLLKKIGNAVKLFVKRVPVQRFLAYKIREKK